MPRPEKKERHLIHATSVAIEGRAVLILGPSGSGKSALGLELMAYGASLIADDITYVSREGDDVLAEAPETLPRAIECRGMGLISADLHGPTRICLVVDLAVTETQRLPPPRQHCLLGINITLVHKIEGRHFPAGILQYVKGRGAYPE